MKNEPIFLTPIFQERIWGGTKLQEVYEYAIPSGQTGECWAISAHPNGESIARNGEFEGYTLSKLWEEKPELFGHFESDRFPLLTKILDANADLSVQVHPNDNYAREYEFGELGKTECWYIIDCEKDAEMIFGHHAQSKEEFVQMIHNGHWDDLLHRIKIKPGDFFYVPSGTIHALCKGTLVLETQQSSDTTYRVYDYNRMGQDGKLRELHLDKAIKVTTVPHRSAKVEPTLARISGGEITKFLEEDYFSVYKWSVQTSLELSQEAPFTLGSVISGNGTLRTDDGEFSLRKGDHFILPKGITTFTIEGNIDIIASHPNNKGDHHHDMETAAKQMAHI
ncbi:mannose-6-phosphate isomerase, class I [Priestia koreensis]|uniref:Mannose-6-phosphate isomerase n=1 Tax=Priestia koreensis TaxID=284581 RepID=A0A0M0LHA2_9BACI|nr:mannose-6-phosphate isomerase, class I [Priestia koreensis]KOO50434.1 mannose-6-phosphate isomerase [Priestia koreensis]